MLKKVHIHSDQVKAIMLLSLVQKVETTLKKNFFSVDGKF